MLTLRRLMCSRTVQFTSYHLIRTNARLVSAISTTVLRKTIGNEVIDTFGDNLWQVIISFVRTFALFALNLV
jgi:hypothetical protein